jgi:hypothetical protein
MRQDFSRLWFSFSNCAFDVVIIVPVVIAPKDAEIFDFVSYPYIPWIFVYVLI